MNRDTMIATLVLHGAHPIEPTSRDTSVSHRLRVGAHVLLWEIHLPRIIGLKYVAEFYRDLKDFTSYPDTVLAEFLDYVLK